MTENAVPITFRDFGLLGGHGYPPDRGAVRPGFRYTPTQLDERIVSRPRITAMLASRFDVRLVTIEAGAGFGKTHVLAQAVHHNALDPRGEDLWFSAAASDDRFDVVVDGLLGAIGERSTGDVDADLDVFCSYLWSRAPREVALILDDVHHLGASGELVMERLLGGLPANAHLVVSGRRLPPMRLGRLRSAGEVFEVGSDELLLDGDELRQLTDLREATAFTDPSRHVATADLLLTTGRDAVEDYLNEEVLDHLPSDRRSLLTDLAIFDEIDGELVALLGGGRLTIDEVVAGLPLVEALPSGARRLHSLLREPLARRLDADRRRSVLVLAAEQALADRDLTTAVERFAAAGATGEAVDAARRFLGLPVLMTSRQDHLVVRRSLSELVPDSAVLALVNAQLDINLSADRVIKRLGEVATHARNEADTRLEAIAHLRAIQTAENGADRFQPLHRERLAELAPLDDFAAGVWAHVRSEDLQHEGRIAAALEALDGIASLDAELRLVFGAERLCDLGRPEEVATSLSPDDLDALPAGGDVFIAFAMWLRADLPPEAALEVGRSMIPAVSGRGHHLVEVSLLGVVAFVALSCGDVELGEELALRARDLASKAGDERTSLFASMALAAVAVCRGDEEAAADLLDPIETGVAFGRWPSRPMLLGLAMYGLLRPEAREPLAGCDLGPIMTVGAQAGAALVALREHGDGSLAATLPWSSPDLLRIHLLPPHLAELAVAAVAEGVTSAAALCAVTGPSRVGLLRSVDDPGRARRRIAEQIVSSMPIAPSVDIEVLLLGPVALRRDGLEVGSPEWVRRARVRELLAFLVEHRQASRSRAMEAIWPDLDAEKASSNLRVTLAHLHKALEPDRPKGLDPSVVVVDGDVLRVAAEVRSDVDRFVRLVDGAAELDRAGCAGDALGHYETALSLVRGPFAEGIDGDWTMATSERIDSRVRGVLARIAELEIARGEPERALGHAQRAAAGNALDERAARALIRSYLGIGDRATAHQAAVRLLESLHSAGLGPERETSLLWEQLRS